MLQVRKLGRGQGTKEYIISCVQPLGKCIIIWLLSIYRNLTNLLYVADKNRHPDQHVHCTVFSIITTVCILLLGILLAPYLSPSANFLNQNGFRTISADKSDDYTFRTNLGRLLYNHKSVGVAPNNLPHFPGPFVGRDRDVSSIIHNLFYSLVKMVHIFGLPAVGKSTLVIHVGYEMASRGVAVRYINVDDTHIFKSHDEDKSEPSDSSEDEYLKDKPTVAITKTFTDIKLSWYSHTETRFVSTTAQGLIEWAKGLSNSTLLILDNCDSLLQGKEVRNNDFIRVLDALSKASPYLCTVTTSRLKINLLDAKPYNLKPLDNESAVELLQLVSPVRTRNNSRIINEMLDGIPLALKIVGSLISEIRPPNLIIRELQQNLMETLTPEDVHLDTQKMRPVLRLSYNYLDNATKECALYLSHFPGSFSEEAALHVLSNCTNSTPIKCLKNLTDTSLLGPYSYSGQSRYQFHKVIRNYLADVESCTYPLSLRAFRFYSSFVLTYTQILNQFIKIYNEIPQDEENIGRFECESHNFEYLLQLGRTRVYFFNNVCALKDLLSALNCDLMLEIFTKKELLKVGKLILVIFESRMDNISQQIGAMETLNIYHDILIVLRKWIHSFPEENCNHLCEVTFPQQNYTTRVEIIGRQLAKINHSALHYYMKLQFTFIGGSICLTYCLSDITSHTIWFCAITMFMEMVIIRFLSGGTLYSMHYYTIVLHLLFLFYCQLALFSSAITLSLYTVISLGLRHSGNDVLRMMIKHEYLRMFIAVLYYSVLCVLLACAFRKHDTAVINIFFFGALISGIGNLFSDKFGPFILHISCLVFAFNTYIHEHETLLYMMSRVLLILSSQRYHLVPVFIAFIFIALLDRWPACYLILIFYHHTVSMCESLYDAYM